MLDLDTTSGDSYGRQPSMANLGLGNNGARRCCFWNLAPPSRFHHSRLFLGGFISLAWTAVRSLVHCSGQGSAGCHTSPDFDTATPSPVNHLPSRCGGLLARCLFVVVVARGMASRSCVRSLRFAGVGSSDD